MTLYIQKLRLALFSSLFLLLSACGSLSLTGEGMSAGAPAPFGAGAGEYKTNAIDQKGSILNTEKMPTVTTKSGVKVKFGSNDGLLAGLQKRAEEGRDASTLVDATRQTLSFMGIEKDTAVGKNKHLIETQWYQPESNERMKIKSLIDTRDLNAASLQLGVQRQSLSGGSWVNRSVPEATVNQIEQAIFKQTKLLNIEKEKK